MWDDVGVAVTNLRAGCVQNNHVRFSQYIKLFVVRVCDGSGRGCNAYAGRVQNNHLRFSFHKNGYNLLQIVKAAAGLDTLRCRRTAT